MNDLYNIKGHNKQLTDEEIKKEVNKERRAAWWAVCFTVDHTLPGCQQDDNRDKIQTIAFFKYPIEAEDFINNCFSEEQRKNFYIVRINNEK